MFNDHLKRIRKVSKRTQQELADFLNISTQSVSKWENGISLPSIEFLPKLAKFFNCTINTFFSEYELQIFEQFEAIDDKQLMDLLIATINSNNGAKDEVIEDVDIEESIPIEAMFLPAVYNYLRKNDQVSISSLQKHLRIGYALGGRIIDALEKMGIVKTDPESFVMNIIKEKVDLLVPFISNKV